MHNYYRAIDLAKEYYCLSDMIDVSTTDRVGAAVETSEAFALANMPCNAAIFRFLAISRLFAYHNTNLYHLMDEMVSMLHSAAAESNEIYKLIAHAHRP